MKGLTKYFEYQISGFLIFVFFLSVVGCKKEDETEKKINQIELDVEVHRFDREFATAQPNDIPTLKSRYPYLFPAQFPDSIWEAKLRDTLQIELSDEVDNAFGDFKQETRQLESLFKHISYYFPKAKTPKIITLISDVRYEDRIILTDSLLLVGLDNYLGQEHRFYQSIPRYVAQGLNKEYLASDIASAFTKKVLKFPRNRTFLSRMVHYGKELYLKDILLPENTDAQKINYTEEEIEWAQANEERIWRYFVERELLYSTESSLDRRFLDPAPFSKFQLVLDSESPGRLGRYMGWQIVRAYMEKNPKVQLVDLLDMPADELFKNSNYKPKR
ncbi:gliding motility lipoprotein GldB [Flagellimonas meridianipacifica]|nr:gliding motility lipoprotein GldB [Allomuricauda pacifica]